MLLLLQELHGGGELSNDPMPGQCQPPVRQSGPERRAQVLGVHDMRLRTQRNLESANNLTQWFGELGVKGEASVGRKNVGGGECGMGY
jgi:hypothetical protein